MRQPTDVEKIERYNRIVHQSQMYSESTPLWLSRILQPIPSKEEANGQRERLKYETSTWNRDEMGD